MQHHDHVALIRDGVLPLPQPQSNEAGPVWAELGSGDGAFTLALVDLLEQAYAADPAGTPAPRVISIDRDSRALQRQRAALDHAFPNAATQVTQLTADYRDLAALHLPPLDGVLAANTLHYVRPKPRAALLRELAQLLRPGGRFIVVEYNVDRGNLWVPHAFSATRWQQMAHDAGLTNPRLLHTRPSRHLREIYAASATRP